MCNKLSSFGNALRLTLKVDPATGRLCMALLMSAVLSGPALAQDESANGPDLVGKVCELIESNARKSGVPEGFFARLIWKESRFDPGAISPKGAEGIAQFMPATARRRGLDKPFEPESAISASAGFLADLQEEFGNWGQAAAAYNAGEERVYRWRAGKSGLPAETLDYVHSITGHPASEWKKDEPPTSDFALDQTLAFQDACKQFPLVRAPLQRKFANTYFNRGLALTAQRNYRQAIDRYTVAIRLKPKFPHAYNNRGLLYRRLGKYELAIANYDAATRQDPKYAAAYNNRGYAKRRLGQFEAAIEDYNRALQLRPTYTAALFNRGFARARLGRTRLAIADYSAAIRQSPKHGLALYNRALAYIASGNIKRAEADLNKTIAVNPRFAKAYYRRAHLLRNIGKTGRARRDYRAAVTLNAAFAGERYRLIFE